MANKEDFKVGQRVRHGSRDWYQKCTVIKVEDGCNGGIVVECEDAPNYSQVSGRAYIKDFIKDTATFCPQDLIINQKQ